MRRFLVLLFLCILLAAISGRAAGEALTAPAVTGAAAEWMPEEGSSFGSGLQSMLQKALPAAYIQIQQAVRNGVAIFCCVLLVSILSGSAPVAEIAGAVCITALMLSLIHI